MRVKVLYHGMFKERAKVDDEIIEVLNVKNMALMNVIVEIINNHDTDDNLIFETKNIVLGETFKVKINGELAFSFADLLQDGDLIDICPVPEGEEYV